MTEKYAQIGVITHTKPIPGADRIHTCIVFGFETICSKNYQKDMIGVFFEAGDTQLSTEFCHHNNLFRDNEQNIDKTQKGYVGENGHLITTKLLKVKSEGLFLPLESLSFTGCNISELKLYDKINVINGIKICSRYMNERTRTWIQKNKKPPKPNKTPYFKEHIDTEQLGKEIYRIPVGSMITIHHKMHGTSHRVAHTPYEEKTDGVPEVTPEVTPDLMKKPRRYEYITASRRVVFNLVPPETRDSYSFRYDLLERFKPHLDKNMSIYMEVVGYVDDQSIMPSHGVDKLKDPAYLKKYGKTMTYKYLCSEGKYDIYVYRIVINNPEENIDYDYSPMQVEQWCQKHGFKSSLHLCKPFFYDGDQTKLLDFCKTLCEREDKLCEDYVDPSHINEGIVVRCDYGGLRPIFFKMKSFPFRVLEGLAKASNNHIDMEEVN